MARVSQFMMQKLLQALLSRENLGKVLYLEHYMKFYLDIEMCQTILLQNLPTDWTLFTLKITTLVQTTSWCFLITCYVVLEILLNARLENWRHGGGSYAKQLTYKSSQFTNLLTVALCCTISVNEIAGAGSMKKKCKLKLIYIGMTIKQHQISFDEVCWHNTTEGKNIRDILTKYILGNLPGNYSTSEIKFVCL